MRTEIIQVVCAVIGSFGFSFIFHLKRDKLLVASVGGGLTWLFYLLVVHRVNGEFAAYFLATVFATFYAELMARVKKAPATIFVITALIPLIPGGSLYYTMVYLMQKDMEMMRSKAAETAMLALAIAMGITIVIMLLDLFSLVTRAVKHRPAKKC